jgi:amino acid transporter
MAGGGKKGTLGLLAVWAIAVGGMVGGGIFSTLGVVISSAGHWAALSFVAGGLIAYATGHSLAALTVKSDAAGGIYTFLRDEGATRVARASAWILLARIWVMRWAGRTGCPRRWRQARSSR